MVGIALLGKKKTVGPPGLRWRSASLDGHCVQVSVHG
jgi:hypothetical protein